MKIEHRQGNLFDTEIKFICQGVNTQGVMGAGIAKLFREKYPEMYKLYRNLCKSGKFNPGDCFIYPTPDLEKGICNLATQEFPGPCAKLEYIEQAIRNMLKSIDGTATHVAMPRIGCGIGGLVWEDVEKTLASIESGVTLVVYTL